MGNVLLLDDSTQVLDIYKSDPANARKLLTEFTVKWANESLKQCSIQTTK